MARFKTYTDEEWIVIGRRYRAEVVDLEGDEVVVRWTEDLPLLSKSGYGTTKLAKLQGLLSELKEMVGGRSEAVAAKSTAIDERDDSIEDGWEWIEDTTGALEDAATEDAALAKELDAAYPEYDSELAGSIRALHRVLTAYHDRADEDFDVEGQLAGALGLADRVEIQTTAAATAKVAPMLDTQALDLIEGKIITLIGLVNKKARKVFRRLGNDVKVQAYCYSHLRRRKKPKTTAATTPITPPSEPPPEAPASDTAASPPNGGDGL